MKKLLLAILLMSFLSCETPIEGMSPAEFNTLILAAETENIKTFTLTTGWYEVSVVDSTIKRYHKDFNKYFAINPKPIILPENFVKFKKETTEWGQAISFTCDEEGTAAWTAATKRNLNKLLIFILDDEIISIPRVGSPITNGSFMLMTGQLNEEKLESLELILPKK